MKRWTGFSTSGMLASGSLAFLLSSACDLSGRGSYPVEVSDEAVERHLSSLAPRVEAWRLKLDLPAFDLPSHDAIRAKADWFEFAATPGTTCYFHPPARIEIGSDKWESGCVPHELGHLALHMVAHPCWGEFEHPNEEQKCKDRF